MAEGDYRGLAGYRQMLAEVRESVFRNFPETQGNVFFVDRSANIDAEMERANQELGIPDIVKMMREANNSLSREFPHIPGMAGITIPLKRADGSTAYLVYGVAPDSLYMRVNAPRDPEQLQPEHIAKLAFITLHEVGHTRYYADLESAVKKYGINSLEYYRIKRDGESMADAFAIDVLGRNGLGAHYLQQYAAEHSIGDTINAGTDPRIPQQVPNQLRVHAYQGSGDYDASDELLTIARRYYAGPEGNAVQPWPSSYHLENMADSADRVATVFNESPERSERFAYFVRATSSVVPLVLQQMRVNGSTEEQMRDWVHSHPDYFYGVPQTIAAQAYIRGEIADYQAVPMQVSSLEQATGNAMRDVGNLRDVYQSSLVQAYFAKLHNPQASIDPAVEAQIFQRLHMDEAMPSMEIRRYDGIPALKEKIAANLARGIDPGIAVLGAIVDSGIPRKDLPQASSIERWNALIEDTQHYSEMATTRLWNQVIALSDDPRVRTPEAMTAWTMWRQLVNETNPAIGAGKGLNVIEALDVFLRLPQQTIDQLAAGRSIEQLVPQIQALLATQDISRLQSTAPLYLAVQQSRDVQRVL